jgi:F-type H+-transporting ATPase subunit epsilon
MRVSIIAPDRSVFDDDADSVVAPAFDGLVGILPKHAPFMTLLGEGTLTVETGGTRRAFHVKGGFMQVVRDTVRVVAEHAETQER